MSKYKGTKGPWQAGKDHVFTEQGILVHTIKGSNDEIIESTTRLISAAPELIELVDSAFEMQGDKLLTEVFGMEWVEKARSAIHKAVGD